MLLSKNQPKFNQPISELRTNGHGQFWHHVNRAVSRCFKYIAVTWNSRSQQQSGSVWICSWNNGSEPMPPDFYAQYILEAWGCLSGRMQRSVFSADGRNPNTAEIKPGATPDCSSLRSVKAENHRKLWQQFMTASFHYIDWSIVRNPHWPILSGA